MDQSSTLTQYMWVSTILYHKPLLWPSVWGWKGICCPWYLGTFGGCGTLGISTVFCRPGYFSHPHDYIWHQTLSYFWGSRKHNNVLHILLRRNRGFNGEVGVEFPHDAVVHGKFGACMLGAGWLLIGVHIISFMWDHGYFTFVDMVFSRCPSMWNFILASDSFNYCRTLLLMMIGHPKTSLSGFP